MAHRVHDEDRIQAHGPALEETAVEVAPGQVLLGKYRVDRVVGRGGFGYVVAATHLHLGERAAIKFLHAQYAADPTIVARFLHEAQAAARLKSNHVVHALDVGTLLDGSPFMVMEYLEGEDLESILRRDGRVPLVHAATWLLDACEAIAEAHAHGIVHRDLKPSNIFLARGPGRAPVVKVLDFGISKFATAGDVSLTRTSTVLGSPMYSAPEQLRSTRNADARSDIWSLGATLYHLVSGMAPFPGETVSEICMKVATDPVPSLPRSLAIPSGFEKVIAKCLEKDPANRFQDIAAFAKALAPFAGEAGAHSLRRVIDALGGHAAASPAMSPPGARGPTTITGSAGELHGQRRLRRRAPAAVATAVLALVAGAVVAVVLSHRGPEPPPPPPPPAATTEAVPLPATTWDAGVAAVVPDASVVETPAADAALPPRETEAEEPRVEPERPPRSEHRRPAKKPKPVEKSIKDQTLDPFEE